jgi:hypothetical protein
VNVFILPFTDLEYSVDNFITFIFYFNYTSIYERYLDLPNFSYDAVVTPLH